MNTLALASIVTAFDDMTIGSKVVDSARFLSILDEAVQTTDFQDQRVPGQAYIPLPETANSAVSAGVGRHTNRAEDYVLREHRGKVSAYLGRDFADPVTSVAVVVYTREAYLSDPDVAGTPEASSLGHDVTHVLVAVLASAGPASSPLTPGRLVHNLAGGNKEALEWTADEIRQKAEESLSYYSDWTTVAD